MGSSEAFLTNGMSAWDGALTKSLLDSASLSPALDDNSALTGLSQALKTSVGLDPVASGLNRLSTLGTAGSNNSSQSNQDFSTNQSNTVGHALDNSWLFKQPLSLTSKSSPVLNSNSTTLNSTTGYDPLTGNTNNAPLVSITSNDPLTGAQGAKSRASVLTTTASPNFKAQAVTSQSQDPSFAVKAEGTVTINNSSDFDFNPANPTDDALIYGGAGFTINGNPVLPVQRDAQGHPIVNSSGKPFLVNDAVAVAAGYSVSNGPSNQYANLLPPQVIAKQTVTVPAYATIEQQELTSRNPSGTAPVKFNAQATPLNNAQDWATKFPAPGTAGHPQVVEVTNGGLNVPDNVNLSHYIITVDSGDLNFNGSGQNLNDVVLVANNGNINLSNVQSSALSVFASGSINMNGSARFTGNTILANGSSSGNITFNGATKTTNATDNLSVISQGSLTYNASSDTRGTFLSAKDFTFNGKSTLYGSIGAKGNIVFNGNATIVAVNSSTTPPVITAGLAHDTAPGGTNTDKITSDATITGTVTDASPVTAFKAGFDSTSTGNFVSVLSQLAANGNYTLTPAQLATVYGGSLPDGVHTLHLQAQDQSGNISNVFDFTFTLDTQAAAPTGLNLLATSDSGISNSDLITNVSTPTVTGQALAGATVQLFSDGQLVGQTTATTSGIWQVTASKLADGTHALTATATDVAGNISPASTALSVVIDTQAPVAPSNLKLTANSDTGSSNSDNITDIPTPTVTGIAEAGSLVQLFSDSKLVGQTTATATGTWQIATSKLTDGTHSLTATATDTAGNVSPVSTALNVVIDTQAPVAPSNLKLTANSDTGSSNSDNITNIPTPTVTGIAEAGSLVQILSDGTSVGQTTATTNGTWQIVTSRLTDGTHALTATATDVAGNVGLVSAPLNVVIDTQAPVAPSNLKLTTTSDTGSSNSDNITDIPTTTVTGNAEAGSLVQLFSNGTSVGQTTTAGNGTWQVTTSQLADGIHTLTATATDIAGNISIASSPLSVTIDSLPPQLTLTTPVNQTPLTQGARLTGTANGTGSAVAALSYHFDSNNEVPISFSSSGAFDQPLNLAGLSNGDHTLIITTTDVAGNVTKTPYNVTVNLDQDPPVITAKLSDDTATGGTTNSDGITSDPTITGTVTDASTLASFTAGFDNNPVSSFVNVLADRTANGSFTLSRTEINRIYGGQLPDGFHTLHLQATDSWGNTSAVKDTPFTLDTTPPPVTFDLDPASDSAPAGDHQTTFDTVTLTGQTEVNTPVQLQETQATTTADATGYFSFSGVHLNLGDNTFHISATDLAGNQSVATQTITRLPNNSFTLTEGQSFSVSVDKSLSNLQQPSQLTFSYNLAFDGSDLVDMKDAFEVALIDANGHSLVHTIEPQREAFFNLTEGQSASLGADTSLSGTTVTLNLPTLGAGQTANLIFRLVNNDKDTHTTVTIHDLQVLAGGGGIASTVPTAAATFTHTPIDFTQVSDVSSSLSPQYGRTSFNAETNVLYSSLDIQNLGQYPIEGPLLVAVNHLSDPSIKVKDADGVTPDGLPYYDFTQLVTGNTLTPGQSSQSRDLAFYNPKGIQFTYDLQLLAHLNRPPVINSTPGTEALIGHTYTYNVKAYDPENDPLSYTLLSSPQSLNLDSHTGQLSWTPTASDLGTQSITLQVQDNHGGQTQQSFNLNVRDGSLIPDRPPLFTSTPIVSANVNQPYSYQATATDPDYDPLNFSLVSGPQGMTVDHNTGVVSWTPTGSQLGTYDVTLGVADGRGGTAQQAFKIQTQMQPGDHPPIITSTPETQAYATKGYTYNVQAADPDNDPLTYSLVTAPQGMAIDPSTGLISWVGATANPTPYDVKVQVSDGRGGIDTQSYKLNVSSVVPGQLQGQVYLDNHQPIQEQQVYFNDFENPLRPLTEWSTNPRIDVTPNGNRHFLGQYGGSLYGNADRKASLTLTNLPEHDNLTVSFQLYLIQSWDGSQGYEPAQGQFVGPDYWDLNVEGGPTLLHTTFAFPNGYAQAYPDPAIDIPYSTTTPNPGRHPAATGASEIRTLGYTFYGDEVYDLSFTFDHSASSVVLNFIGGSNQPLYDESWGLDDVEVSAGLGNKGLANQTVYIDTNANGHLDPGEPSTLTDSKGHYSFTLNPGTYTVAEQPLPGWTQTIPTNKTYQVNLTGGQVFDHLDFSNTNGRPNGEIDNVPPVFVSSPPVNGMAEQEFRYRAIATDLNGDPLSYELLAKPEGMVVDSTTGLVSWRPTDQQVGEHDVILRVKDPYGGVALQPFQVEVAPFDLPPVFDRPFNQGDRPFSPISVGQTFQYRFQVVDEGKPVTYSLTSSPSGAVIDPTTGLLTWTPTANQLGDNQLKITATDNQGGATSGTLHIQVNASVPNVPPVITSNPRTHTTVGQPYLYQVVTNNPNNDPLTYSLVNAPSGMAIDNTGKISWTPSAGQLGTSNITISVNDGQGNTVNQSYQLQVVNPTNLRLQPPQITSNPPSTTAVVGQQYRYTPTLSNPDNDFVAFALDSAPNGMVIDQNTGTILWTPTSSQVGPQSVTFHVTGSSSGSATESFTLNVQPINVPPVITSTPGTQAAIGKTYLYAVAATDPENNPLSYSLTNAPTGMVIDAQTGLIQWTPDGTQLGNQTVALAVTDSLGGTATQSYTLVVSSTAANLPPTITSQPAYAAAVGQPYQYQVTAQDPEGAALTYSLQGAPSGMTIDPVTGLVQWTPTGNQAGTVALKVIATDPQGAAAVQGFNLTAIVNHPPTLLSQPVTQVTVGLPYVYDLKATDPDGAPITYSLDKGPQGMTIDAQGRVRWTPTTSDIGTTAIVLSVKDNRGAFVQQSFNLSIAADTQAPSVNLTVNQNSVDVGKSVTFVASATDNVKVQSLQLVVNGNPVALDANGTATVQLTQVGKINAIATATDAAGNNGQASTTVQVINPTTSQAPVVNLDLSAITNGVITAPTDIRGTVTDSTLDHYSLEVAPIGSSDFQEMFRGTQGVTNGVLGKFDPTLLEDGTYTLRLEAEDVSGAISSTEDTLSVAGDLKLGNFRLSFTDLSIPVAGIPINLTRTYDSLTAGSSEDFGYGWRLEYRDIDLRTSLGPDEVYQQTGLHSQAFTYGTRVYLTVPGGKREGFTFKPSSDLLGFYHPKFVADAGVTDTLSVQDTYLIPATGTNQFYDLNGDPYSPADPLFGGNYTLTTKEGIVYKIDGSTDKLLSVTNPNGNSLTFTDAAITSSTGQQVTFGRDAQGRITSVTDPMGQQIHYQYDAQGNLISVTDRDNNTTQFVYDSSRAHYLDQVIDPLGRTGVKNQYDSQGRLVQTTDALGKSVQLTYDPSHDVETIKDALGNPTTYEYDERGNIVTETNALGGVTKRTYDDNNNLLTQTDPNGNTTTYTYDGTGNLITATDPLGNTIRYTYNKFSEVLTRTNPLGNTTTYTYGSSGNRLSLTNAEGDVDQYTFDTAGRPTAIIAPNGSETQFQYDSSGNIVSKLDALGHKTTYTYDGNGNQLTETTTVTLPTGSRTLTTQWTYDANNHVTSITDPDGNVTHQEYDQLGHITAVVDPLGHRTEYTYDEKGNLVKTLYADGTSTSSVYDALGHEIATTDQAGNTTNFVYDALGRLVKTVYPDATPNDPTDNPTTSTEYDQAGRVTAQIDERGNRTQYQYDADGHQTVVQDALGNKTTYTYDAAGEKLTETDALNHTTQYSYDAIEHLIATHFADGTSTSTTYDAAGRRSTSTNQAGMTTHYEYDALNRIITTTDPLGAQTTYTYDELGHLLKQTDANHNTTTYEYDDLGWRTAIVDALGNKTTYTYDALGNQLSETDALGHTTKTVYDVMNRPVEVDLADGTHESTTYDVMGRKVAETDQAGTATRYEYDAQGRLTAVVDAMKQRTTYKYDLAGDLISQTDANGHTTNFNYDALKRQTAIILPLGQSSTTTYDAVGNISSTTDFNGHTISYQYDAVNRRTAEQFSDGTSVKYTYTSTGQRQTVTDASGVTTNTYDGNDRLVSRTDPDGQKIQYTYDSVGNRTSVIIPAGTTTYTYDALNRLATVTDPNSGVTTYHYNAVGNLVETDLPNATVETRTYDALNRLVSLKNMGAAGIISSYNYTLDAVGDRTAVDENSGRHVTYTYDALHRLTSETITDPTAGNRTTQYTYDAVGSRLSANNSVQGVTTYTYDANDRLLNTTNNGQVTQYTYDNNGNTLSQYTSANDQTTYHWDDQNRLIGADVTNATETHHIQYRYNSDGIRVAEIVDGQETRYLIDANRPYAQVLEEYSPGGTVQAFYVYGQDLISQNRSGVQSFYEKDGLGSIRALTNASGSVTDTYTYDAYGNSLGSTGTTVNNYRYAGEPYDLNLGEYYQRARYYEPAIGRFSARDPFEGVMKNPLSLAKYPYVDGNPVNATDPSGLLSTLDAAVTVAGLGTLLLLGYSLAQLPRRTFGSEGIVPDYLVNKGNNAVDKLASSTIEIGSQQGLQFMRTRIENCNSIEPMDECDFGDFPVIVWGNNLTQIRDHTYEALFNLYPSFLRRISPPWSREKTAEDEAEIVKLYGQTSQQLEDSGYSPPRYWYNVWPGTDCYWNPFVYQPQFVGKQCDEYPYASTLQGGRENFRYGTGVSLALVDANQNFIQGNWLLTFYIANNITGTSPLLLSDWFGVSTTDKDNSYWERQGDPEKHYF